MNPLNHVAIIMDGNGRWGIKNKKSRNLGHKEGIKAIENIIDEAIKQNIKFLTLFAFSTDNWKRPSSEVKYLFNLLKIFLKTKISNINQKKIKLKFIGKKKNISKKIKNLIFNSEKKTVNNNLLQINIAIDYGSQIEIIDTIKKLNKKKIKITKKNISNNLYTKGMPDPDILIRTGNTKRLSNFLLWQLSYTEIFFSKKLWPDFNNNDFLKIIKNYKKVKRNYGSI